MSVGSRSADQPVHASPSPFFYGWYIVLCGFLGHAVRMGLGQQTFGFFFKPMIEELKWSHTMLTTGVTIRAVVGLIIAPFVGVAEDRYGPRFLMAGSAAVLGLSLMLLSQTDNVWHFVVFYGLIGAFGNPGLAHGVINPTIAKWFIRKRGFATAIAHTGINVGSVVCTPLVIFLIASYGWRSAWVILGVVPWIVVLGPSLLWLRRQPEDLGLQPDGDAGPPPAAGSRGLRGHAAAPRDEVSWTARAALRTPAFWLLSLASVLYGTAYTGDVIHRVPYIVDMGFSNAAAGTTLVIYNVAAFLAKFFWGPLADRWSIRWVAIVILAGCAVGGSLLIGAPDVWQLYAGYAVVYGLTMGALYVIEPLIWARYFGRRFLGSIRGIAGPFGLIGTAAGPMLAAVVHDRWGDYHAAFGLFVGLYLVAAVLVLLASS